MIDAETGAVSLDHPPPWYLQALQMSRPLHFGDYGGVPLKVLWSVFDLIMIYIMISGLLIGGRRFQVLTWIAMAIPLVLIAHFWFRSRSDGRVRKVSS